jgi:L-serine dehydratase
MAISVFDLFRIGIGPSSSHTVGPMRAARRFAVLLEERGLLEATSRVRVELFGSLALTGRGHGTDRALIAGLEGQRADQATAGDIESIVRRVQTVGALRIPADREVRFSPEDDIIFREGQFLPFHPNGMRFEARDATGHELLHAVYYSVGGGFVVDEAAARADQLETDEVDVPLPFHSGAELLARCGEAGLRVSDVVLENEKVRRPEQEVRTGLLEIWEVMQDCVRRGLEVEGMLPGALMLPRRAPALYRDLTHRPESALRDPLTVLDWVDLYALAVNEENAAGGRVVTAPTNGAAGIVPAVLHYYDRLHGGSGEDGIVRFLLCAGAIGMLYKENASISGAEVGCQGEVGVACSMAAAGLTEVLGGSPGQVENAAEIGMEHHLGLTCDPVGGLVQIPCIERNAVASVNAINAARIALRGTGQHFVSLDKVIATMRQTGADMQTKYKETSLGGLAVNVSEC